MARIRSLKPQVWQDEKIGQVSREARLLFVGLITMADDDGRFRTLPSIVTGQIYPRDQDAARKLPKWLDELVGVGLIEVYGEEYGWFPTWDSHQKISHKTASILPDPRMSQNGVSPE